MRLSPQARSVLSHAVAGLLGAILGACLAYQAADIPQPFDPCVSPLEAPRPKGLRFDPVLEEDKMGDGGE